MAVRVLAIDGGGIRGIVPAVVLADLERRTGRPVADLFDLVAGTSTGGVIACALGAAKRGGPAWSAEQVAELYEREGPRIFHRSLLRRVESLNGLIDEKYSADGLDDALRRYLGERRLSETLVDLLLPTYDTAAREPVFFKTSRARDDPARDLPLRLAARATSSAPTYFEPLELGERSLVDGGVFAVNPAMCGLAEVLRDSPGADVLVVSLGTGQHTRPLPFAKVKDWGALEWARPILDVVFDGSSDAVDYQLRHVLPNGRYWRLQTELTEASDALDDARPQNIRALRRQAERLVAERARDLERIAASL